ncbi:MULTISPECIES: sterol carrier family protein [Auritidibacter]|uniref:Sterol carrier family protein n=1 Tax=Auritidibacter ignavus TaxID=678932 RepID=A0AAJ6AMX5_9MICC|nr:MULTISPECIES: sterol carrier family protein [Auritidibacter]NIH71297.1 hypothetical protein [Auritidibacter ignavus]PXA78280.1 hypothetical protein DCC24_00930 [Auritidibacter sp. NML100628]RMX23524.1 hypothetical protein DYI20_04290 [Auritidibacter ignavus]WGH83684.1 sterol carrier family protein [Auritidibacter ignavus]WGH85282.1 sterol carrier family protein [Auritidibacter ignavus]
MARRKIDLHQGRAAVDELFSHADYASLPRAVQATAIRFSLEELADRAPGKTVEVRVPPFGVTQCIDGPEHTRGTPPNVIETNPETWMELITGEIDWDQAVASGRLQASGSRADLTDWLPLFHPPRTAPPSEDRT